MGCLRLIRGYKAGLKGMNEIKKEEGKKQIFEITSTRVPMVSSKPKPTVGDYNKCKKNR